MDRTDGVKRDSGRQSGKERREACWTIRGGREDENIAFLSVRFPSRPSWGEAQSFTWGSQRADLTWMPVWVFSSYEGLPLRIQEVKWEVMLLTEIQGDWEERDVSKWILPNGHASGPPWPWLWAAVLCAPDGRAPPPPGKLLPWALAF